MAPSFEEATRLLRFARRDEAAFDALLLAPQVPASVALFHAQQAVEKALKALMSLHGLEFRRTHDLDELAAQLADAGHGLEIPEQGLSRLTPYAVQYRYDDEAPQLLTGAQAGALVRTLLSWAEGQMGSQPPAAQ